MGGVVALSPCTLFWGLVDRCSGTSRSDLVACHLVCLFRRLIRIVPAPSLVFFVGFLCVLAGCV